jgi:hypothetical protein
MGSCQTFQIKIKKIYKIPFTFAAFYDILNTVNNYVVIFGGRFEKKKYFISFCGSFRFARAYNMRFDGNIRVCHQKL